MSKYITLFKVKPKSFSIFDHKYKTIGKYNTNDIVKYLPIKKLEKLYNSDSYYTDPWDDYEGKNRDKLITKKLIYKIYKISEIKDNICIKIIIKKDKYTTTKDEYIDYIGWWLFGQHPYTHDFEDKKKDVEYWIGFDEYIGNDESSNSCVIL